MDQADNTALFINSDQSSAYRTHDFNFRKEVFIQLRHTRLDSEGVLEFGSGEWSVGMDDPRQNVFRKPSKAFSLAFNSFHRLVVLRRPVESSASAWTAIHCRSRHARSTRSWT